MKANEVGRIAEKAFGKYMYCNLKCTFTHLFIKKETLRKNGTGF